MAWFFRLQCVDTVLGLHYIKLYGIRGSPIYIPPRYPNNIDTSLCLHGCPVGRLDSTGIDHCAPETSLSAMAHAGGITGSVPWPWRSQTDALDLHASSGIYLAVLDRPDPSGWVEYPIFGSLPLCYSHGHGDRS